MSQVISLLFEASRRGHSLDNRGDAMSIQNSLLLVNLPLIAGESPKRVMVLLAEQRRNSTRLVLSDEGGMTAADFIALGDALPDAFGAEALGDVTDYLAKHQEATSAVVTAGGALHGNLTLARAVSVIVENPTCDPAFALAQAIGTSQACAAWSSRINNLARDIRRQ